MTDSEQEVNDVKDNNDTTLSPPSGDCVNDEKNNNNCDDNLDIGKNAQTPSNVGSVNGKKKKKKESKKKTQIDKQYSSDDDTSDIASIKNINDCDDKDILKSNDVPVVATGPSFRRAYCLLLLFVLSIFGAISGGVFVFYTVQFSSESKMGKFFIRSGQFINDLNEILFNESHLDVENSSLSAKGMKVVDEETPIIAVDDQRDKLKEVTLQEDYGNEEERIINDVNAMEKETVQEGQMDASDSIERSPEVSTQEDEQITDDVDVKEMSNPKTVSMDTVEENDATPKGEVAAESKNENPLPFQEDAVAAWSIGNVIGVVLFFGSVILRYRPWIFTMKKNLTNYYFFNGVNIKYAWVTAISCFLLSVIAVVCRYFVKRGIKTPSLLETKEWRLSDVLAITIIVLSTILFVTKRNAQSYSKL